MPKATWKSREKHGGLTMQSDLPDTVYAFPKQRKEPLTDAKHVRSAVARFDQVTDVSDIEVNRLPELEGRRAESLLELGKALHGQKRDREAAPLWKRSAAIL
jgi:hypothetical protein